MKRGEIYYIENGNAFGAEIRKARPGVIVSNDLLNNSSEVVEVVFLTTQQKKPLPTHVCISATGRESTVLCEQVNAVAVHRIGNYCGKCSPDEMAAIDHALLASLDLAKAQARRDPKESLRVTDGERRLLGELERVRAERDRYARMLDYFLADEEAET